MNQREDPVSTMLYVLVRLMAPLPTPKPPPLKSQNPLVLFTPTQAMSPTYFFLSKNPKSNEPGPPFLRFDTKRGCARFPRMLSNQVSTFLGRTWLRPLKLI